MLRAITSSVFANSSAGWNWRISDPRTPGHVAWRHVVGVARLVGLLAVAEAKDDLTLEHVTPVRALALVAGKTACISAVPSMSQANDVKLMT